MVPVVTRTILSFKILLLKHILGFYYHCKIKSTIWTNTAVLASFVTRKAKKYCILVHCGQKSKHGPYVSFKISKRMHVIVLLGLKVAQFSSEEQKQYDIYCLNVKNHVYIALFTVKKQQKVKIMLVIFVFSVPWLSAAHFCLFKVIDFCQIKP